MHTHDTRRNILTIFCLSALIWLAGCSSLTTPGGSTTPNPAGTPIAATNTPTSGPVSWASVVIADTTDRANPLAVENLNPFSGNRAPVASLPTSANALVDSVSPSGALVAMHIIDSQRHATFSVASLDGHTAPHVVGTFTNIIGSAVWKHDNAHLAVTDGASVFIFAFDGSSPTQIANVPAAGLLGFSPDDSALFYIGGTGVDIVPGALYRLPLSDPAHPVQLTPRQINPHYLLSQDGSKVYYQNSGASGASGLYVAPTATANSGTLLRANNSIPVGFTASGALLTAAAQNGGVALVALGTDSSKDTLLVADLVGPGVMVSDLGQGVRVAPDGSAVIALGSPSAGGFAFYLTDLTASPKAPKIALSLPSASRADLVGFDTITITSGS